MASSTPRLGLVQLDSDSDVDEAVFTDSFAKIDAAPGKHICTSSTRPVGWGSSQNGREIFETDTALSWYWDSGASAFKRSAPKGLLGQNSRTTDISTSSTSYVTAVSQSISVPAGGRYVMVCCSVPAVQNDAGLSNLALFRDSVKLTDWLVPGDTGGLATEQEQCGSNQVLDLPTVGTYTYSLQFRAVTAFGGTTTLLANSQAAIQLWVVEL